MQVPNVTTSANIAGVVESVEHFSNNNHHHHHYEILRTDITSSYCHMPFILTSSREKEIASNHSQ